MRNPFLENNLPEAGREPIEPLESDVGRAKGAYVRNPETLELPVDAEATLKEKSVEVAGVGPVTMSEMFGGSAEDEQKPQSQSQPPQQQSTAQASVSTSRWAEADAVNEGKSYIPGERQSTPAEATPVRQESEAAQDAQVEVTEESVESTEVSAESETPMPTGFVNPLTSEVTKPTKEVLDDSGKVGRNRVAASSKPSPQAPALAETVKQTPSHDVAQRLDIATLLQTNVMAQVILAVLVMVPIYFLVSGDGPQVAFDQEMKPRSPGFPSLDLKPRATGIGSADVLERQMKALAAKRQVEERQPSAELSAPVLASKASDEGKIELTREELQALLAQAAGQGAQAPTIAGPQKPRRRSVSPATSSRNTQAPVVELPAEPVQTQRRRLGRFFESGGQLGGEASDSKEGKGGLFGVGTVLEAKLDVGVTSTRHGIVIAKLTKAVKTLDGRTLVAGTVIKGRSSDDGSKVFLDFQAAMVGQSVVPFGGYAVRTKSKTPGLVAKRTGGSDADSRAKGRVTDTALEVGSDLARAVGGTTGEVLGDLADGATDEARRGNRPSRAVLTLDAGVKFQVVVTK